MTEGGQSALDGGDVVGLAVEHDLLAGNDVLLVQQPFDLGVVDAPQPCTGEGHGSGNMPSPGLAMQAPAVVCGQRPHIDDRQVPDR